MQAHRIQSLYIPLVPKLQNKWYKCFIEQKPRAQVTVHCLESHLPGQFHVSSEGWDTEVLWGFYVIKYMSEWSLLV